jgi:sugar phosphate permease
LARNPKSLAYWQKRTLWGATFAYTIYYFCRVNISIAIPLMQRSLGVSKTELGFIASALQVAYGAGKFTNGVIGDRSNPRYFMAAGLFLSGIANIAFSRTTSLTLLAVLWTLNGWFQSMGFPSGARLLSHYYKRSEHGRSWTIFGCSHQVGACVILIAGGYLGLLGWRNIFAAPGVVAVLCSTIVVALLRDVPHKNRELAGKVAMPEPIPLGTGLRCIVRNPNIWALAIGNLFLYIVRYGLLTWSASFLIANRGISTVAAGWLVGIFEFAGLFGGLSAGWISDLKSNGRRGPVMAAYMLLLVVAVVSLWFAPASNKLVIGASIAACGFLVYGPLMLVSVAAAGYVSPNLAGSASGLAGLFGYIGATLSGVGLGATAEHAGWPAVFGVLIAASLLSAVCFAFTMRTSTSQDYEHETIQSSTT